MEVLNPRSSLLSNYEVLTLLQELESTHLERSKAAVRIKKEEEAAGAPHTHSNPIPDISENIRTIQVEAIQYLSSDYLPAISNAEKLQIVNMAPTTPVELYVIVEELEDRLGDAMDSILSTIQSSLSSPAPTPTHAPAINGSNTANVQQKQPLFLKEPTSGGWEDMDADGIINDVDFVDHGEGAGIEGDLDVEEG
ncbi:hypothetical protein AN958_02089 [Leucoagaricus sp. SymC.cos]|nr:hypothetical protein AN958_02089 [Leucoagaricus sp. SymC.cos]